MTMDKIQGLCEDCREHEDLILSCDVEACSECWHLLPREVDRVWQKRWDREHRDYQRWLYQL